MMGKKRWIFKKHQEFKKQKSITNKTKPKTSQYLEKRAWKLASEFGFLPTKVVVKKLKSRWGSAGKTGTITINEELTKTPPRLIDYIIIHELCHLKIQNHSYRYWNLVRKYCPQYEKRKMELDNLGIL
jgi:predicted metal-dependent hydrolase